MTFTRATRHLRRAATEGRMKTKQTHHNRPIPLFVDVECPKCHEQCRDVAGHVVEPILA